MPGMTRNMAKGFLAFWVIVFATELYFFFF
jgi:hypothetical protein